MVESSNNINVIFFLLYVQVCMIYPFFNSQQ